MDHTDVELSHSGKQQIPEKKIHVNIKYKLKTFIEFKLQIRHDNVTYNKTIFKLAA
jgi:hypothetical protein